MRRIWYHFLTATLVLAQSSAAWSQVKLDYGDGRKPWQWDFTVQTAPEAEPALRFRLLPPQDSFKPGNAAPHYYRATMLLFDRPDSSRKEFAELAEWISTKPYGDPIPVERLRKLTVDCADVFYELDVATCCELCDWSFRIQDLPELKDIMALKVPELLKARRLANLLRLKARLEIVNRNYDAALRTLQMGFRLGQNVDRSQTLPGSAIGAAICIEMTGEVAVLIAEPDAPNLYWGISALSGQLINYRPAMEQQMAAMLRVSLLKEPEQARTENEWKLSLGEAYLFSRGDAETERKPRRSASDPSVQAEAMEIVVREYPQVKSELKQFGLSEQRIEELPPIQAIAIHEARVLWYQCDEKLKWAYIPYWQVLPYHLDKSLRKSADSQRLSQIRESFPLFRSIQDGVIGMAAAAGRLEHRLAWLQTIEALRMHAAQGKKLPEALQEVKLVPIPLDPTTGQAIQYQRVGESAVLTFAPSGLEGGPYCDTIRLTLRKKN